MAAKNPDRPKRYHAKLLLFGEYTIIKGSSALAVPYRALGGEWAYNGKEPHLQERLPGFAAYLKELDLPELATGRFTADLEAGLYFASDIPRGYGLGSSGALCAAVYDRYAEKGLENDRPALRKVLARMECFFHGSSSGTDPLICYLDRPVKLHPDGRVELVALPPPADLTFFLLDTGISRQTGPLVALFLEQNKEEAYRRRLEAQLIPATERAIDCFLNGEWKELEKAFQEISAFQLKDFTEMIPLPFRPAWEEGLAQGDYLLKLCGAGGGGFLLGMTTDWEATRVKLGGFPLRRAFPEQR